MHTFSSNRLQRKSLAALKQHLQSLDKAAAAPVVITLSQPSQSHLTVDDESLDMAATALITHTDDHHIVPPARGSSSSSSASVGVGSSSLSSSSSSASSYTTPSYTSSYTTTSYAASLQQPSQQSRPHFVRRSARNAASLCRQRTSSRANVDDYDEAMRQKLLALYRKAGNCLRFRVSLILNVLPALHTTSTIVFIHNCC